MTTEQQIISKLEQLPPNAPKWTRNALAAFKRSGKIEPARIGRLVRFFDQLEESVPAPVNTIAMVTGMVCAGTRHMYTAGTARFWLRVLDKSTSRPFFVYFDGYVYGDFDPGEVVTLPLRLLPFSSHAVQPELCHGRLIAVVGAPPQVGLPQVEVARNKAPPRPQCDSKPRGRPPKEPAGVRRAIRESIQLQQEAEAQSPKDWKEFVQQIRSRGDETTPRYPAVSPELRAEIEAQGFPEQLRDYYLQCPDVYTQERAGQKQ
jgi:hypothetical protein